MIPVWTQTLIKSLAFLNLSHSQKTIPLKSEGQELLSPKCQKFLKLKPMTGSEKKPHLTLACT